MNEGERLRLIQEATAEAQAASQTHGWNSTEARSARQRLLEVERTTAAEMGMPYASPVGVGAQWDPGAPMPCVLAGIRTFLVYYLRREDPAFHSLGPDEPGWEQEHGVGVIEFHNVEGIRMGSPNDEVLYGHPLYGYGLEFYGAQVVSNSPWIGELAAINRLHPQFSERHWTAARHYLFPFHDESVECVASDATAWTELRTMEAVVRQLAGDVMRSS